MLQLSPVLFFHSLLSFPLIILPFPEQQKAPKFVSFFIHGDKAPLITLRTGNKTITLGMRRRQFTTNWNTFCFEHQLQFGDALVFIPETKSCYTVLIFDKRGVEKLFPLYNKFCIFSDAPTSTTLPTSFTFIPGETLSFLYVH